MGNIVTKIFCDVSDFYANCIYYNMAEPNKVSALHSLKSKKVFVSLLSSFSIKKLTD
jgi:hypothetical protein